MTDTLEEGQTSAPEAPPAKTKTTAAATPETEYVLLSLNLQTENAWVHRGPVRARSAEQAVRNFAKASELTDPMTLVAIPARSWRPVTVRPTTVTSLVIEEAS